METGSSQHSARRISRTAFLKDVFLCALGSYGGPEAHYGVFSSILVQKRKYLTEEELTEMIGLYALVPGPSSTQTITAIGYHAGGPILALLTFLVWALPAIITMALIGVLFTRIDAYDQWKPIIRYLPAAAVAFIIYAAFTLSKKVLKKGGDGLLYAVMLALGLLLASYSPWVVPALLITGGLVRLAPHARQGLGTPLIHKPRWLILAFIAGLALISEGLSAWLGTPLINIFSSFYRYGYSVIGGGQIVIPLMIQDIVGTQSMISLEDFLSGYAIDQAVPGPLFSFAAFVASRSFAGSGYAFLMGLLGGLMIFLPGTLFVFFIFPLWKSMRGNALVRHFLSGVTLTAAALIAMTAITQIMALPVDPAVYGVAALSALLLLSKKIPAPLIVAAAAAAGFLL